MELNTGVGMAEGLVAGGTMGTLRKRSSTIGTLREYADTGMNMAFLDSYFSEVILLHSYTQQICDYDNKGPSRNTLKYS